MKFYFAAIWLFIWVSDGETLDKDTKRPPFYHRTMLLVCPSNQHIDHRSATNVNLEGTLYSACRHLDPFPGTTHLKACRSLLLPTKEATEAGDLLDSIEWILPCRAFALYHVKRSEVRQPAPRIPKTPFGISSQYWEAFHRSYQREKEELFNTGKGNKVAFSGIWC